MSNSGRIEALTISIGASVAHETAVSKVKSRSTRVSRRQQERGHTFAPTVAFAGGYLIAWTFFSLIATALQWVFEQSALLSPMMVSTSPYLGGTLLLIAGVYQWTPLKHVCLENCRSPHR